VSARIVQFAASHGASILVFEHLGNLQPEKGKYSRRGNTKRAYWMKGRIFHYAKYKGWQQKIITSRVNPRNTSRECHRCHSLIIRYAQGHPVEGYTPGAPLCLCPVCALRGHSDYVEYTHPLTLKSVSVASASQEDRRSFSCFYTVI
jgi:transposase